MANSTVEFENIDEEFPKAGQDNDSQGFRDNFSIIKSALQQANLELADLITYVARKDVENDFNGEIIKNAVLESISEKAYNSGTLLADSTIQWSDGMYQNITIGIDDITLILGAWPSNGTFGKVRIAFRSNNNTVRTINLVAANTGIIRVDPSWPAAGLRVDSSTTPVIVDFWTSDGGSTVFAEYIGDFGLLS